MRFLFLTFLLLPYLVLSQNKFFVENLGSKVNSKYDEVNPMISPDGQTLYFVRKDHPNNTMGPVESADIWYSQKDNEGKWNPALRMPAPFNQARFNGIFGISADGNTVIIKGAYKEGKYIGVGLSVIRKKKKNWTKPEALKIDSYDKMSKGIYDGAFLCNDNKTLLIYLSEKKNDPTCDLYVSFQKNDGTWTKPASLGKQINTSHLEACPFMAADGVTLYFSSTKPDGFGDADIYKTTRLDDSWTNWSQPENLGEGINSENRETYYSIPASAEYAFLVVNPGDYGKSDIVKLKLEKSAKPEPVVLIKGKVLNAETKQPLEAGIRYQNLTTGKELGIANSDPETGEYTIVVPKGSKVGFYAESKGYFAVSENIDLESLDEYKEVSKDLLLMPIKIISVVTLNNIFFETGSSTLKQESTAELEKLKSLLTENPSLKIEIQGHTDDIGDDESNRILSEKRAEEVTNYLVSNGIPGSRVKFKGFGETKPLVTNDTEENRARNRRVEFQILEK